MPTREPTTAADILTEIGRILADNTDDWQARLAVALEVRRETIRDWRNGRVPFGPDHRALDDLFALVVRREAELRRARERLQKWLQDHRQPPSPLAEDLPG